MSLGILPPGTEENDQPGGDSKGNERVPSFSSFGAAPLRALTYSTKLEIADLAAAAVVYLAIQDFLSSARMARLGTDGRSHTKEVSC